MKRDIKYILKRVIIGILIGLFFIMFKSCNVNASTIDTEVLANFYFQSQYCEQGEAITKTITGSNGSTTINGNRFSCTKGPSYKFFQYLNNTEGTSVPALFSAGQLLNNFTFEITFPNELQIITTTDRYIELRAPWSSTQYSSSVQAFGIWDFLPLNGIYNNSTITYSPTVSTFFNQPQYCSWTDRNGNVSYCNVNIAFDTSISRYVYYIDIPVSSVVRSITLYFGNSNIQSSYDLYTSEIPTNIGNPHFRAMTPTIYNYYSSCNDNSSNFNCYKIRYSNLRDHSSANYNIYNENNYSGAGLIYYYYPPDNPTFTPSTSTQNIWFADTLPSDRIIYNFSSFSQTQRDYYNNLINNINEELSQTTGETDFFSDFYEGFTTSSNASGFISLFNNMFLYPLQKLNVQKNIDLVRDNINGDKILNNHLCMKNSQGGLLGAYNPYQVQFYRDYKFTLPCPHTEIYTQLKYGDYAFYPSTFMGASLYNGGPYNFADIWLTIQHGFLVYILFVNCLNLYKYVLDSKHTEIEVLEL